MNVTGIAKNRAVRTAAGSVAALALAGGTVALMVVQDRDLSRATDQVSSFECAQALHGKPVVAGGGSTYSGDQVLTCPRPDGSSIKVFVPGFDSVVHAVQNGGLPDSMKLPG